MPRRLVLASLLAAAASAQSPSSDVAVGVFPFLVGNMDGRIAEIVTQCTTRGIDTLYVSAFRATGPSTGDLWITDRAGDWNPAWGQVRRTGAGIDLRNLIAACHAANLRVVAVLKCFHDNVQPSDAAHKQYLLSVIDYFVDAYMPDGTPVYDLDGLALDYIRYVGGTGVDPLQVTNFLADVRRHLGGLSLHAYLIASRYTFDGPTYDGNFASYAQVLAGFASQYGQHWEQMARHVDVMMPMAYTADGSIYSTYALHQAYVRRTALYARTACQNAGFPTRRVQPTIKTYADGAGGETTTDLTVEASITGALLGGGDGYQAFRYQHLMNNPSWWTKMAQFAVPGQNWPVPVPAFTAATLTATVDCSLSRDADQSSASLQARFDFDTDGVFDTAWLPNAPLQRVDRRPGTWLTTVQVRDAQNHVSTTRRRRFAGDAVTIAPPFLSAAAGGAPQIRIDVGPGGAGGTYLAIATLSGTSPGFTWQPGFPVPINVDFVTSALAADPNGLFLQNGLAPLDALGRGTATLQMPPGLLAPFAGATVHWSFLAVNAFGLPLCTGEAKPLAIVP